jgi:hypothetical protein
VNSIPIEEEGTAKKFEGYTFQAGESTLHAIQVFTSEKIARTAIMHKSVTSVVRRHKRTYIAVPSILIKLSIHISHFFLIHLGRNLAQLLAYVLRFSSERKIRIRLRQIPLNV